MIRRKNKLSRRLLAFVLAFTCVIAFTPMLAFPQSASAGTSIGAAATSSKPYKLYGSSKSVYSISNHSSRTLGINRMGWNVKKVTFKNPSIAYNSMSYSKGHTIAYFTIHTKKMGTTKLTVIMEKRTSRRIYRYNLSWNIKVLSYFLIGGAGPGVLQLN